MHPLLRAFSLCFITGGCTLAADYHVAPTGLDSNPGTLAQPWLTIQKAASTAAAGDVANIHAGTYPERVTFANRNGTSAQPIIFQKYPADTGAAIISQDGIAPPAGTSSIVTIENCDHLLLRDLEIANYKTAGTAVQQRAQLPAGIYITGAGDGIELHHCKVHDIWQSSPTLNNYDANGFGIAIYGNAATPIDHFVLDGCEVYNLRTGASESVSLNGNVTNFTVTRNTVHDCNNIGIDFIGFEGTNATAALDQARGGICSGNTVYRIDSKFNPVYGGNFTSGGPDTVRSAPGLYVDGGRDILIERNHVYDCNYGLSAGSEHQNKVASNITVRNNLFHHCHVGGIVIGGSGTTNGGLENSSFTHNTLYGNDTAAQGGGQFSIQNYVTGTVILRNLMASPAAFAQFVVKGNTTGSFAAGAVDWNLYWTVATSDYEFDWQSVAYNSFSAWQGAASDTHSIFTTAALGLIAAAPTKDSPASDFALTASSPAVDSGDSAMLPFTTATGEKTYFDHSRIAGGRVDIGADEFMTSLQAWRDLYFSLPDGGPGAEPTDDPDGDGIPNLIEYSQGMNPLVSDIARLPSLVRQGESLQFRYRKAAAELTYTVETSPNLRDWSPSSQTEQTDGTGLYWREVPDALATGLFIRLKIVEP
jgi:hypothetical protein